MAPDVFICPICGGRLVLVEGSGALQCSRRHSFDIARQGYVSLVTGSRSRPLGDTTAMTQARMSFLASGLYEPIAKALLDVVADSEPNRPSIGARPLLADLGGGTGYYSTYLLDHLPTWDGVLLDASTAAARVAARAHPQLAVATADLWHSIPLASDSCSVALVVFAPRNPAEIARILVPGGACVVVTPTAEHLNQVRSAFGLLGIDPEKPERLTEQFAHFRVAQTQTLTYQRELSAPELAYLVEMGPNAFHKTHDDIVNASQRTGSLNVTISVQLTCFTP